jgi:NhaC family Na+:H+ antiporter
MWSTLAVHPFAYLPYAFLNLINPLVSAFYGFTGLTMEYADNEVDVMEGDSSSVNA